MSYRLTAGSRSWPRMAALIAVMFVAVPAADGLDGQIVEGRLLDSNSGQPIMLGTVVLLDSALAAVDQVFTDESGSFILEPEQAGSYYVLAVRLGYTRKLDGILELGDGGQISIDFYMRPQPIVLEALSVEAERRRIEKRLQVVGFYERKDAGFGYFMTPEQIGQRNAVTARDLLRNAPRLWVVDNGVAGQSVVLRKNDGEPCTPRLYVDGARVTTVEPQGVGLQLEEAVSIADITGIEFYDGPAAMPLVYGGTQEGCGLLLIWTRAGR